MPRLDQPLLVLVTHVQAPAGYELTPASAQVLALARSLTSGPVDAVSLVDAPDAQALAAHGVRTILLPGLGGRSARPSAVAADAVLACLGADDYGALLLVSTYRGREIASRLAALTEAGAVVDAAGVEVVDSGLRVSKTALAGSWTTSLSITRGTPIIAVRSGAFEDEPAPAATAPSVVPVDVAFSPEADAIQVVSSVGAAGSGDGRPALADASTVVVGGRGTDGDFGIVEELADALSGAVGATRVASDEGWVPRSIQIGQTGLSVSPNLYVGLGVSGAIHHTVGMQSSAHIVAVCDDPDAPIFEIADFGVVGDLFDVVPQALEEIRRIRSGQ
ncbi:electron transfer flavoprotein subunit alpha/FixB family protein [Actinomyces sp. B33]|uniref:electron transfer flavoprotein subunit alpha/FixB family protein n=1 Tax=Actinomyces sp. B33 TaxID=2942131 RepID=UPI0023416A90|nr:electron transfer flavoprotein subunit alpha/FixB family protein [Actinomyces sp. B33]MDC4232875.1 electron transfer flavoprotein subunit alpha/FixB family protein [Actinomyces sp. B33]